MINKFVLHCEKYGFDAIKGLEIHDRREILSATLQTNPNIDWTKVRYNYDLSENENSWVTTIKEKIKNCKTKNNKAIRKDAVVLCSLIVSASPEFFMEATKEEQDKYFKRSYNFLCSKFGKENVVGAIVHNDETTPHMHFSFVPMTNDNRLCAKEIINRNKLQDMQWSFELQVGIRFNLVRDPKSQATHISKEEYTRELNEKQRQYDHYKNTVEQTLEDMPQEFREQWNEKFKYYDNPTKYLEEKEKQRVLNNHREYQQQQMQIRKRMVKDDDYGNW